MSTQARLTAKPTEYAGPTFRSRIEARWAVFFETLGIAWEYEEHGYDLVVGKRKVRGYLPDFWLPDVWGQTGKGIWFEVKGAAPDAREKRLAQVLAKATGADCYIASGGIPAPSQLTGARVLLSPGRIDGFHPRARRGVADSGKPTTGECWTECECGAIGIQRNGLAGRMRCATDACGPKSLSPTTRKRRATDQIQQALVAATSARFEHGQWGATILPTASPESSGSAPITDDRLDRAESLLREALDLVRQVRVGQTRDVAPAAHLLE